MEACVQLELEDECEWDMEESLLFFWVCLGILLSQDLSNIPLFSNKGANETEEPMKSKLLFCGLTGFFLFALLVGLACSEQLTD